MSEHLKIQIYASEAKARSIVAKAAIVTNDSAGIEDGYRFANDWGVHPDVIECIVVTWNDDDPDDEMIEPQGSLTAYADIFGYDFSGRCWIKPAAIAATKQPQRAGEP